MSRPARWDSQRIGAGAPPPQGIVLRIAHWHRAMGVRDGLAAMAAAYEGSIPV